MKHFSNIFVQKISWLNIKELDQGGVISDLYYPESIDELVEIVLQCQKYRRKFYVLGHTSNCYFLPSFSPDAVISILYLRGFSEDKNTISVECGMHSKVLAKMMVEKGYEGFEGLIDLPGTVSGAIYGNAGCYGCLMSNRLISVKVLTPSGDIVDYSKEEFGFKDRSSKMKEGFIKGTIISAKFEKIKGDIEVLNQKAQFAHEDRLENQPGPANNLGSIFKKDEPTLLNIWIERIVKITCKILCISDKHLVLKLKLFLAGYPKLEKYLYDYNRFIWVDSNAYKAFEKYLDLRKKLYKHNDFEIEIFK